MTLYSYNRGYKIYFDGEVWRYVDTQELVDGTNRPCIRCSEQCTGEGPAVLGELPGFKFACAGRGGLVYITLESGVVIQGNFEVEPFEEE